jgi:hypothetical protein
MPDGERARERERERQNSFAINCLAKEASLIPVSNGTPVLTVSLLVQRNEHILLHVDSFTVREGDGWRRETRRPVCNSD